jgi:peptide/nickel transport system permease protein
MAEPGTWAPVPDHGRPWDRLARGRTPPGRLRGARVAVAAGLVVLALVVLLPGGEADRADFANALLPPSGEHPFGTDQAGRDLLARSLAGARVSLLVGLAAAVSAAVLGTLVGGAAGALARRGGGGADALLMRVVDGVNALPHLVLGIVVVAMLGPSLTSVVISIAVTHWTTTARLVRAELLALSTAGFVEAAVGAGASRRSVLVHHQLPHVAGRVLLATVLMVPHAIMHESALSFLGLGLGDDRTSLGTIIEQSRTAVLAGAWWPAVLPGLVLVGLSLLVVLVAERVRPRSVGRA